MFRSGFKSTGGTGSLTTSSGASRGAGWGGNNGVQQFNTQQQLQYGGDQTSTSAGNNIPFPIPNFKWQHANPIIPQPTEIIADGADAQAEIQTTHAALTTVNGTVVVLKIDKIGLKDAETYIDPFVTVLLLHLLDLIVSLFALLLD